MRILLDECLPRDLARELVGHEVSSVSRIGWAGVKNGALLELAAAQFDVFVTIDQHRERLERIPNSLALITLEAPTNRIESLCPLVPSMLSALESVEPGTCLRIRR